MKSEAKYSKRGRKNVLKMNLDVNDKKNIFLITNFWRPI